MQIECGYAGLLYKYARVECKQYISKLVLCQSRVVSPRFTVFFQHLSLLRCLLWTCGSRSCLRFRLFGSLQPVFALHVIRHIFEISDDSRMRITTKTVHDRNDDFALRYVRIYPGVNSRAELVTLAPGLRSERRFAPLARGQYGDLLKKSEVRNY